MRINGFVSEMEAGKALLLHALKRDTLVVAEIRAFRFTMELQHAHHLDGEMGMLQCIRQDSQMSVATPVLLEPDSLYIEFGHQGKTRFAGSPFQERFSQLVSEVISLDERLNQIASGAAIDSITNQIAGKLDAFYLAERQTKLHGFTSIILSDFISRKLVDPHRLTGCRAMCEDSLLRSIHDNRLCDAISSYGKQIDISPDTVVKGWLPDGSYLSFTDVIGSRPVILDFWASWCGPCIREMPALRELYSQGDIEIIGISIDGSVNAWQKSLDKLQLPWINVWDEGNKIAKLYQVTSVPTKFVIDKNGVIVARNPDDLHAVLAGLKD